MRYAITSIEGNRQRLDGGAMFGNAPHALWRRWVEPDAQHRIPLACRAFLIEDLARDRRILLEAGIGSFFEPKLRDRYGVTEEGHQLLANLAARGVAPEAIDVVVLSHLHFDHAGGLLGAWQPDRAPELVFPRARFLVGRQHWERATAPHQRDRVSFIPELHALLEQSGRLEILEDPTAEHPLGEDVSFHLSDGHTPGLMLAELSTEAGMVVFAGDLIPGRPWIHLPITMGYDRYPERLIDEKAKLLGRCVERDARLLLTHDAGCAVTAVAVDDRGRYCPRDPRPAVEREPL